MKSKLNQIFLLLLLGVFSISLVTSCSKDEKEVPVVKEAFMTGFKLVNAGPNMDLEIVATDIVEGENPVLSVPFGTDVTNLEVAVAISEGAAVAPNDGSVVDFTNPVSFVVTNEDLSTVYTFSVVVEEAQALNITSYSSYSGDNAPGDLTDNNSRAAGSDEAYLYVPDKGVPAVYAISLEDIKNGSVDMGTAKTLSTEGIDFSGTSFKFADVKVSGGNIYACSMSGKDGQWVNSTTFKVWKWSNVDAAPEVVIDWAIDFSRSGMEEYIRLGDSFTVDVDQNGDGAIYVTNNNSAVKDEFYKFTIAGFALSGAPTWHDSFYQAGRKIGSYGTVFTAPEGELLVSGADGMFLCNASGDILVDLPSDAISPRARGGQVFEFNGNRYLAYVVYNEGADKLFYVEILDVTGGSLESALAAITAENVESKLVYKSENFHGANVDGNSSGSMSVISSGDGYKMTIFNAKNGFVYFELM